MQRCARSGPTFLVPRAAERRLVDQAQPSLSEFLVLRYRATNIEPYPFEWTDLKATELDNGAILTRISREYDRRFRWPGISAAIRRSLGPGVEAAME